MMKMVRVMSIHHFPSQHICTTEEPKSVCTVYDDLIFVALPHHIVEVRNLNNEGQVVHQFPTVDEVQEIKYSKIGNYVLTLERKRNMSGSVPCYVRIYVNWDVVPEGCDGPYSHPMRARIAGRVTPSNFQAQCYGLEMIELPVRMAPRIVTCCQETGNILLASGNTLAFYFYRLRKHAVSRLKFIDFEEANFTVHLNFNPNTLEFCETVIAAMNQEYVHIFQLGKRIQKKFTCFSGPIESKNSLPFKKGFIGNARKAKFYTSLDDIINERNSEMNMSQLINKDDLISAHLPSVAAEQASTGGVIHKQSPFRVAPSSMTITVTSNDLYAKQSIINILQLQLINNYGFDDHDEFRCLKSMLMCTNKKKNKTTSLICMITTQQEGYMYHFPLPVSRDTPLQQAACISVYPFTSPVSDIALEPYVFHALTDTGLETYTSRAGHYFTRRLEFMDNIQNACPLCDEPVHLIGIRPFIGLECITLTDKYLVLFASSEGTKTSVQYNGNWTIYSLELPSPSTMYNDIVNVASSHRWTSPSMYYHLLSEGHVILRTALACKSFHSLSARTALENSYKESCVLLGDFFVLADDEDKWCLCTPYYLMSGLSPMEVIDRVTSMDLPPDSCDEKEIKCKKYIRGLLCYLKRYLSLMEKSSDLVFTPKIPIFINTLLDLFEENDCSQVSSLVLKSSFLRDHATDRVLSIMKKQLSERNDKEPSISLTCDALALVLLCIQKGSPEQAVAVLHSVPKQHLFQILKLHWYLLFDTSGTNQKSRNSGRSTTFSELATVLVDAKPIVLGTTLAWLVASSEHTHIVSLYLILQVFKDLLPIKITSKTSPAAIVLQTFLEGYFFKLHFRSKPFYDSSTTEGLRMLIRCYLGTLLQYKPVSLRSDRKCSAPVRSTHVVPVTNELYKANNILPEKKYCNPFDNVRPAFLDCMPPIAPNAFEKIFFSTDSHMYKDEWHSDSSVDCKLSLIKLQSLLCLNNLPTECYIDVSDFLNTHPGLYGNLSLQVLCCSEKAEAIHLLLNFCPQAIVQFCKDKCVNRADWRILLSCLRRKIDALKDLHSLKAVYEQILRDVLNHLIHYLSAKDFKAVIPPECSTSFNEYFQISQQIDYANQIHMVMMKSGQQLLHTLKICEARIEHARQAKCENK